MSLVSINQPYRKAMINNKYNYQDITNLIERQ